MGGQLGGLPGPQQPRQVPEEIQTGPRAMQLGGLFGNPAIAQMIQALIQSGALGAGPGGFAQSPAGQASMLAPAFQTGTGGLSLDVGTIPPGIQGPAGASPVAPGTLPPSAGADVRAPGQPVQPAPQAQAPALPPPPPQVGAAPQPAYGGINLPQWLAEVIGNLGNMGAGGPQGPQVGGGPNINVFEGTAKELIGTPQSDAPTPVDIGFGEQA